MFVNADVKYPLIPFLQFAYYEYMYKIHIDKRYRYKPDRKVEILNYDEIINKIRIIRINL